MFEGSLEGCNNKKNGEATERRGFIAKHGEILQEGEAHENPVGWSSMCNSPI